MRYESDIFFMQAEYRSGIRHYQFLREHVTRDEINNETFNQGAPPPGVTAYQVDRDEWVAINLEADPSKRASQSERRSDGSRSTADVVNTVISRAQTAAASDARDTLTLTNRQTPTGLLRRMTSSTIFFRVNGQRSDTAFQRDHVKLVTVRTSR